MVFWNLSCNINKLGHTRYGYKTLENGLFVHFVVLFSIAHALLRDKQGYRRREHKPFNFKLAFYNLFQQQFHFIVYQPVGT